VDSVSPERSPPAFAALSAMRQVQAGEGNARVKAVADLAPVEARRRVRLKASDNGDVPYPRGNAAIGGER